MAINVPKAAAAVRGIWLLGLQNFQDGGESCEILGRKVNREQHLADLEQLGQLSLPEVVQ
jgi:hypothetical protein